MANREGNPRTPRLVVVADVGGLSRYHLGDEAMLEANLHTFRQLVPAIDFGVLSRDPGWTSEHYGVKSLPFPQVPSAYSHASWTWKMAEAAAASSDGSGVWTEWLGDDLIRLLQDCAGLVVSGGGNLCATWPDKILERVALLDYAQALGIPTVILSQTLGPSL